MQRVSLYVKDSDLPALEQALAAIIEKIPSLDYDDTEPVECVVCDSPIDDSDDSIASGVCLDCRRHGREAEPATIHTLADLTTQVLENHDITKLAPPALKEGETK